MKYNPRHNNTPVTEISDEEFDKIEKEVVKDIPAPEPEIKYMTPISTVNARREPDQASPSLGVLYPNESIKVEKFDKDWIKILSGDKKGAYVRTAYLK